MTPVERQDQGDTRLAERVDEELKRCLDHAAEGLHWVGPDGTILWANQTELDLLGYSRDEYIGHHIAEFHVDQPVIEDILARLSHGETLLGYEARLRHRDGSIRFVQINSNVRWDGQRFLHTRCFTRDVTERKRADDLALRLASIVEHSDDAILSEDREGRITSWNPAAERLFGYTAAEAIGQPLRILIPPDRWPEQQDVLGRIARGERVDSYETTRLHKDGRLLQIAVTASPIRDGDGQVVGVSKVVRDITTRRRLEAQDRFLVELDDLVRSLSDPQEITLAAARMLGQLLGVSRCAYATMEDDEDTFVIAGSYGVGVPDLAGRYRLQAFGEACARLLRAGEPYIVTDTRSDPRITALERVAYDTIQVRAAIGVPIHKQGRFVALMLVDSREPRTWTDDDVELVRRVAGRSWESMERARVTQHLFESERQFRDLANSIANLAWTARPDGWIYWYNDQWYAYTGTTPADMEGWGWQQVHDPAVLPSVMERWTTSIATGEPFEMVFPLRGANGEFRRFLTRVNPVRDSQGRVVRWFGTNTDVETERRATEAKDQFLAMLGHELRNPLSPILTALQLMKLRGDDGSMRERTVIERQVRHLTRLVDDLLDVSRIARGKVELSEEVIEIAEVVARAVEMTSPLLEERRHTLVLDIPRRDLAVSGDATRLSQVFANLLTNAAKYTGAGGTVTVTGAREGADVVIRVRDNGVGISADVLPRIFDLFVQERQAIDREHGGLGLGLTIVRSLVERHGGTVTAHSAGSGQGAEFVVRLRRVESQRGIPVATAAVPPKADQRGVRILVVDDNDDAADMLSESLGACGYTVRTAHDGPSALRQAAEFLPHVAFVDIGLPVMDGYELARHLLARQAAPRLHLIAVTGYGQDSDRARALEAGFERHLVKPVAWDDIAATLESVVPR